MVYIMNRLSFLIHWRGWGAESRSRAMTYIPIISLTLFSKLSLEVDKNFDMEHTIVHELLHITLQEGGGQLSQLNVAVRHYFFYLNWSLFLWKCF